MQDDLEAEESVAAEVADIGVDKAEEARAKEMGQAPNLAIFMAPETTFN